METVVQYARDSRVSRQIEDLRRRAIRLIEA